MTRSVSTTTVLWRGITLRLRHTRRYYAYGADRIEVRVIAPLGAEIPITSGDTHVCFVDEDEIARAGDAVAYVVAWLDREAATPTWRKRELQRRQLSFDFE